MGSSCHDRQWLGVDDNLGCVSWRGGVKWHEVLPVAVSMLVILSVALLEKHSRMVAALIATMPMTAPLALWVVYSSAHGDQTVVSEFTRGMLLGIFPTVAFLAAACFASRQGLRLVPLLVLSYAVWAVAVSLLFAMRKALGL
jgi:uncharacterized membrane protein (GlpM family)